MSNLYDPINGTVLLEGKDIRSFDDEVRADMIGFILQDPFIFTGTLYENLLYGNKRYANVSKEDFIKDLDEQGLHEFISKFAQGIDTMVSSSDENISLAYVIKKTKTSYS
jgi:ATP-binding cassette subfamily B protein